MPGAALALGQTEIPSVDWWITSRCDLACNFCYGSAPTKDPIEIRDAMTGIQQSSGSMEKQLY